MAPRGNGGMDDQRRPSFFKVMVGDFTKRVRIPAAFERHFKGKSPGKSILRGANRKTWPVEVKKSPDGFFFSSGWPRFVRENSLEIGDFVVFYYDCKVKFDVIVLGKTGCEKDEMNVKRDPASQRGLKMEYSPSSYPHLCKCRSILPEKQRAPIKTEEGHAHEAESCPLDIKNPHFLSVMGRNTMLKVRMTKAFQRETGIEPTNKMCLQDPRGRSWPVRIAEEKAYLGYSREAFAGGWNSFVKGNGLLPGDVCIFELAGTTNPRRQTLVYVHIIQKGLLKRCQYQS